MIGVTLSTPAGSLRPGPADDRLYVIEPVGKRWPYGPLWTPDGKILAVQPPWQGDIEPPACPDPAGHLDHLTPGTRAFAQAHAYGCVRFTLDVWERYLGAPLAWHFARDHRRLEVCLLPGLANATAGYGYLEVGEVLTEAGAISRFSLNFDVLAHEVGHLLVYSLMGLPDLARTPDDYYGFHEAAADLVAMVAALHFDPLIDQLLTSSRGNLYGYNELNRFAELSPHEQLRLASNSRRMIDFARGWTDEHELSEPLTGAMFDILVDLFHEELLAQGLMGPELEDLADRLQHEPAAADQMQALFDQAYSDDPALLRHALLCARDWLGVALLAVLDGLTADNVSYGGLGRRLLEFDRATSGGRFQPLIRNNLAWRQIGEIPVGTRLSAPDNASHACSARTSRPMGGLQGERPRSYHERWRRAHAG